MSGVIIAIYRDAERWSSVGIAVSKRYQSVTINSRRNGPDAKVITNLTDRLTDDRTAIFDETATHKATSLFKKIPEH